MVFLPPAIVGIKPLVLIGLPKIVSGVFATIDGCHINCPVLSLILRIAFTVKSLTTKIAFLR